MQAVSHRIRAIASAASSVDGATNWESPLILSFSPWEKERLNVDLSVQQRPLSHGERDRMRGESAIPGDDAALNRRARAWRRAA
ncbi:MAG: hypothetical protein ACLPWS_03475 [Rhodomicrobium sp.]